MATTTDPQILSIFACFSGSAPTQAFDVSIHEVNNLRELHLTLREGADHKAIFRGIRISQDADAQNPMGGVVSATTARVVSASPGGWIRRSVSPSPSMMSQAARSSVTVTSLS